MAKKVWILILIGLFITGWQVNQSYAEVIIKVRALNPLNSKETAVINYPLPKKVTEADIVKRNITYSLDHSEDEEPPKKTFNISYDEQKKVYYVDDEVVLYPKEVVTLEVHVNDVWIVNREQIEGLKQEVDGLLNDWEKQIQEMAEADPEQADEQSSEQEETKEFALIMKGEILDGLDAIIKRQDSNKIIDVGVEKHIEAYEDNIEELRQVQQDIVLLANLVEFEGQEEQDQEEPPLEENQDLQETEAAAQDEIVKDDALEDSVSELD